MSWLALTLVAFLCFVLVFFVKNRQLNHPALQYPIIRHDGCRGFEDSKAKGIKRVVYRPSPASFFPAASKSHYLAF